MVEYQEPKSYKDRDLEILRNRLETQARYISQLESALAADPAVKLHLAMALANEHASFYQKLFTDRDNTKEVPTTFHLFDNEGNQFGFDSETRIVSGLGSAQRLNKMENQILTLLLLHQGSAVERELIKTEIWGEDIPKRADMRVSQIVRGAKNKLNKLSTSLSSNIVTLINVGYVYNSRIEVPNEEIGIYVTY